MNWQHIVSFDFSPLRRVNRSSSARRQHGTCWFVSYGCSRMQTVRCSKIGGRISLLLGLFPFCWVFSIFNFRLVWIVELCRVLFRSWLRENNFSWLGWATSTRVRYHFLGLISHGPIFKLLSQLLNLAINFVSLGLLCTLCCMRLVQHKGPLVRGNLPIPNSRHMQT